MNREERRRAKKAGIPVKKEPTVNIKLSDLGKMTPTQHTAMMAEINRQCLEMDQQLALDVDTMVLWSLHQYCGWGRKRLHDFYVFMAAEHRRMRHYYEINDLYPERHKLKELGADVEAWQKEVL